MIYRKTLHANNVFAPNLVHFAAQSFMLTDASTTYESTLGMVDELFVITIKTGPDAHLK
mgnify:CR=1